MACSWHLQDGMGSGNQHQSGLHFFESGERVAGTVNKQAWRAQLGKVSGAELVGLVRRMQGIGKKQEAVGELRLLGEKHGGLAPAVGMASDENAAGDLLFRERDGATDTFAIAFGIAAGRAEAAGNTKGKIEAENGKAGVSEGFGYGDEQLGLAIGTGAVGEDESVAVGTWGRV